MENRKSLHGRLWVMTKREAKILAHVAAHFPFGFTEAQLARSLGWPIQKVREGLNTCVVFGLMAPPHPVLPDDTVTVAGRQRVSLADLLTPEELEEARGSGPLALDNGSTRQAVHDECGCSHPSGGAAADTDPEPEKE